MKIKQGWRKGIGLAQIMALLLVVLPTMAFIVTFLLDYWSIMQADHRLKLIANLSSQYVTGQEDVSNLITGDYTEINTNLVSRVNTQNLCPNGTNFSLSTANTNGNFQQILVEVNYLHNGPYLENKQVSTNMMTYSYHDQNLTAVFVCQ